MFFIRIGTFLAWVMTILGALKAGIGLYMALNLDDQNMLAYSKRYFNAANSGEVIDEGLLAFSVGIALGLLAVIANGVHKKL